MAHSFFTYLRLKLIVTLLRPLSLIFGFTKVRRDRLLVESTGIERRQIRIPSRDKDRFITAYLYTPPAQPNTKPAKRPILVNWHGSGFIFPMLGSDGVFCARVARETGMFVLDADYRKAPETPFPGPLNDVEDALKWVAAQPDRFDLSRVAVSGFSAGGNLALVAATALRKQASLAEVISIPVVVAVYPVTDFTIASEAKKVPRPRRPIPPALARVFNASYLPDAELKKDVRVSPGLAAAADFPSTVVIITVDGDTLAPEAIALAERLGKDQTRKVVSRTLTGVGHAFDKGVVEGTHEWEQREEAYTLAIETLKDVFHL
ncbi:Alpha/Beta hydrolase protein [Talaromyces proteolyticus]|uniref:Alpha/Beta hydrolase protein n=1 Tax=Talaromyces proteolyticus TaxID=1131652 RepID=A0AAD4KL92_9EURO|nr:Alpha/Beta hydrolase protein [Talaromyces proteolyticus]KAH8695239.1 Alpha/Beta hydrolase protein [Talaromyces proteolyticus]